MAPESRTGWTRRRVLGASLGAVAAAVAGGFELVDHGVLPGRDYLDLIDGVCDVSSPPERFRTAGETLTGRFYSRARNREVGYTIAYPPGHGRGSRLALGLCLHGNGGSHSSGLGSMSLADALSGVGLPAIALVQADGGDLYWHPHPGDDPMGMMFDEVLPMCQRLGLGGHAGGLGTIGTSMGGYGALIFAEQKPRQVAACAAISPAIWTGYAQAERANSRAYTDAAQFARYDAVTHTAALAGMPVRVASGASDPFHPGVVALIDRLPAGANALITAGCHDGIFFASQRHASLAFLGEHLSGA